MNNMLKTYCDPFIIWGYIHHQLLVVMWLGSMTRKLLCARKLVM